MDEDKTISRRFRRVLLEMPVVDSTAGAKCSPATPWGRIIHPHPINSGVAM